MMRIKRAAVAALCALTTLAAEAAEHEYVLDCLPGGDAGLNVAEVIRSRLELHDWRENVKSGGYHLCFRIEARQIMVPDAAYGGGYYRGGAPLYRAEIVRMLSLRVNRGAGTPSWREDSEALAEDTPQAIDQAVRALIDRLPLD
ncbi:hypothetical protein [Paludibacterium yongneupense]|uniref:hypothetical protein n=1 Tax=Paludibacterium yongneupense TaxID=400061 RepID=UPI00040721AE|nr:hypothetical protein [Paludibacterium yongneupense]